MRGSKETVAGIRYKSDKSRSHAQGTRKPGYLFRKCLGWRHGERDKLAIVFPLRIELGHRGESPFKLFLPADAG